MPGESSQHDGPNAGSGTSGTTTQKAKQQSRYGLIFVYHLKPCRSATKSNEWVLAEIRFKHKGSTHNAKLQTNQAAAGTNLAIVAAILKLNGTVTTDACRGESYAGASPLDKLFKINAKGVERDDKWCHQLFYNEEDSPFVQETTGSTSVIHTLLRFSDSDGSLSATLNEDLIDRDGIKFVFGKDSDKQAPAEATDQRIRQWLQTQGLASACDQESRCEEEREITNGAASLPVPDESPQSAATPALPLAPASKGAPQTPAMPTHSTPKLRPRWLMAVAVIATALALVSCWVWLGPRPPSIAPAITPPTTLLPPLQAFNEAVGRKDIPLAQSLEGSADADSAGSTTDDRVTFLLSQGKLRLAERNFKSAADSLEGAFKLHGSNDEVCVALADVYVQLGREDEAVGLLDAVSERLRPRLPISAGTYIDAQGGLGALRSRAGLHDSALTHYQEAQDWINKSGDTDWARQAMVTNGWGAAHHRVGAEAKERGDELTAKRAFAAAMPLLHGLKRELEKGSHKDTEEYGRTVQCLGTVLLDSGLTKEADEMFGIVVTVAKAIKPADYELMVAGYLGQRESRDALRDVAGSHSATRNAWKQAAIHLPRDNGVRWVAWASYIAVLVADRDLDTARQALAADEAGFRDAMRDNPANLAEFEKIIAPLEAP